MTALCTSCNQPYDANDFCWRCDQHLSEQPPEKTLDELIAQSPPLRDYQLALRARLNAGGLPSELKRTGTNGSYWL